MNVFARSRARYRGIYLIHTANHVNFITRLFEKKPVLPKIYSFSYFKRRSAAVAAGPGEIFISKQIFISLVTHIYIAVRVYIFNKNRFFIFHEIDQQKDDEAGRNYSIIGSETRNIRAPPPPLSLSLQVYYVHKSGTSRVLLFLYFLMIYNHIILNCRLSCGPKIIYITSIHPRYFSNDLSNDHILHK